MRTFSRALCKKQGGLQGALGQQLGALSSHVLISVCDIVETKDVLLLILFMKEAAKKVLESSHTEASAEC